MGKEENQNGYMIPGEEGFGQVQIADEVVAIIADWQPQKWKAWPAWPATSPMNW